MKERLSSTDRLYGAVIASKRVAQVIVAGIPHLVELVVESKDPKEIARVEGLVRELTSRVQHEPIAHLESETGADLYDYTACTAEGYSFSELYKRPRSRSETDLEARRIHSEYERRHRRRS